MKSIFLLLRPGQWLKNLFVLLPLFFDKQLGNSDLLYIGIISFFVFSLVSSSIYCFNDILDIKTDQLHPIKCKRPITSGVVSKTQAYILMISLVSFAILLIFFSGYGKWLQMLVIVLTYYIMNIGYCLWLKHFAIIDVFLISIGFVLRVLYGGVATGVSLSHWIVLMTFLLALFLAFAKRRDDVLIFEQTGVLPRNNICSYNLNFMNQVLTIVGTITIVCYIMYTVSPEVMERFNCQYVYLTSICVLAGIIRYLQISLVYAKSGSPTRILIKDRFIQVCLLVWVLMFFVIIYL